MSRYIDFNRCDKRYFKTVYEVIYAHSAISLYFQFFKPSNEDVYLMALTNLIEIHDIAYIR